MVRYCVAPNCKELYDKDSIIKLHKFPVDSDRRNKWIQALKVDNFVPMKFASLCSKHFEEKCFLLVNNRRMLRRDAIPSIFNDPPSAVPSSSDVPSISSLREILKKKMITAVPEESAVSSKSTAENLCFEDQPNALKRTLTFESPNRISEVHESDSASSSSPLISAKHLTKRHKSTGFESQIYPSVSSVVPLSPKVNIIKRVEESSPSKTSSTLAASEATFEINRLITERQKKNPRYRNPKFVGDCLSDDMITPRKALRNWRIAKQQISKQAKYLKTLHQRKRRLQYRVNNLTSLMKELKRNHDISENAETALLASLPDSAKAVFEKVLKGTTKQKYIPELRSFALTLHFYSTKAYNYVREKFNKSLPHPSTITKWFQSVNGEPGFTEEAINALKMKVAEAALKNKKVFCNLTMDEMYIRTQEVWTGKEYKGHVNIGTKFTNDVELATQALVFMLVAVNGHWKIPVGYFLLNGLQGNEKANLVLKCLEFIDQSGVEVLAVTFDGAPVNITMTCKLGASFVDPACGILNTKFEHPVTKKPIYLILDMCHMLTLIRNCLATVKEIHHESGGTIKWQYFEDLCNLQEKEGLHAGTKLRRKHIRWFDEKMRVKTAAQTFSRSVADAMEYLDKDLNLPEFQGCEETIKFCLLVNDIFDIFNSRNYLCKYKYKKPLGLDTCQFMFEKLEECKIYFSQLKINNIPVLRSQRKTGFLGFLVATESATNIFKNLIACPQPQLDFLLLYKFSQDHLKIFFSAIRSKNNNPNARQFEAAYKRLITHSEIKNASSGNCIALDATSILYVSSRNIQISQMGENMVENIEYQAVVNETDHDYTPSQAWHLTVYQNDVVAYIAGFIVKRLKKTVSCEKCLNELETANSYSSLQERKVYGMQTNASYFVVTICRIGEKSYRMAESLSKLKQKNIMDYLTVQTLSVIPHNVFDNFSLSHLLEDDILHNHSLQLTKAILHNYFNLRIRHTVKSCEDMKQRVRSRLTKTIHFRNQ